MRARLWVSPAALKLHDEAPRLWLTLADGRVLAVCLPQVAIGDDRVLAPLAEALLPDVRGMQWIYENLPGVGVVQVLYAAPVLPPLSAQHAGFVLQPDFRQFVAVLDHQVLALLMRLEREPVPPAITRRDGEAPHPLPRSFFASVRNYNRLVALPPELRKRRMQALHRFPALVAPVLLTAHRHPNVVDGKRHAWREVDEAVEAAIDAGRDLTGALAAHYGISRGLTRAPVNAEYWHAPSHASRRGWLAMLDALPANLRPTLAEFERWRVYLPNYFALIGEDEEGDPLPLPASVHRGAFRLGWRATWEKAARRFGNLHPALADCDDFLTAVRDHLAVRMKRRRGPRIERLAQAWLACHGLLGLLAASERWHRLRPYIAPSLVPPGFALPAVLGVFEGDGCLARELLTPKALAEEGEAMRHCVGGYWAQCVAGERIFSLAAFGERATAQYHPRVKPEADDTVYRLVQLRGPFNGEVSPRIETLAREIEARINAPERRAQRWAVLEARGRLEVAELEWRQARQQAAAWLDAKTRRQLEAVLEWLELTPPCPEVLLCDFIAGYPYHDGAAVEEGLRVGDALSLVREPDNPHDRLAVRLDWQGHKLGYLPRPRNAEIALALDAGEKLAARIRRIDAEADPWERVEVVVQTAP
ncbi:HIRAN domain-containing protein [Azovibrio restrictus]|uniref:HIRAN domain-containing protein n=1 Tax=Azovibrio restrictus TaxID=146938 RepID=UPI0026ED134D|nr:HIRAN domain-containing protein [Azovibrio restrictus]